MHLKRELIRLRFDYLYFPRPLLLFATVIVARTVGLWIILIEKPIGRPLQRTNTTFAKAQEISIEDNEKLDVLEIPIKLELRLTLANRKIECRKIMKVSVAQAFIEIS
ncbi:hypothetical protein ACTXT7_009019 [Hymenolepis weldensis]